jgi:hypothetical protein
MAIIIKGGDNQNLASVDSNSSLKVNLPTVASQAGYAIVATENDSGTLYGSKILRSPIVSLDRRLLVGLDTPLFDYSFNTTVQDSGVWRYVTSTMTTTWATGGMLMNAISSLVSGNGTAVSSYRQFNLIGNGSLWFDFTINFTATPLANQIFEFGVFPFGAGNVVPTEGAYFRFSTAGLFGNINFNSSETSTGKMLDIADIANNTSYVFTIRINEREVSFYRDGILLANGILNIPAAQGQPFITGTLPITFQFRNNGTVSGAQVMQARVLEVTADQKCINLGKPFSHIQASRGLMSSQGTSGNTMGSTALLTNSLAAGAGAAATNTTAALGSGLGGQFSVQPTLTAATDGIICSYQVPAGSVNITPRTLYITGVRVQGLVTTAFTGGPVYYAYSLAYGHTNVAANTSEGVAAKATRRVPLGYETYVVTAPVGTLGQGVYMPFNSPIVVNPGEFIQVLAKNLGTVTSAGVICLLVTFDGYWE